MYTDILLPIDLGEVESWQKAVVVAVKLAEAFGSRLHVLTVVPDFGLSVVGQYFPENFEHQAVDHANAALHDWSHRHVPAGLPVQHIVAHGAIYAEILAAAERAKCDLIVMGSHRPALSDYLLGPNAARVVRHFKGSVLVVRP